MTKEDHEVGSTATLEARPWWRNSHVAHAIVFRAMLVASSTASGLLIFWIARELLLTESPDISVVLRVAEQSFVGCAIAGLLAGIVLGVPLGIVHILSVRASLLDLEQELATVADVWDGRLEQRIAEHDAPSNGG